MYQVFQMSMTDQSGNNFFYDDDGNPRFAENETRPVAEHIWSTVDKLCFSIQQRQMVEIQHAYFGIPPQAMNPGNSPVESLIEVRFTNTIKDESRTDTKLREARVTELNDRISAWLKTNGPFDDLFAVIHYKHQKHAQLSDDYNRMISHFMDLSFRTVCFDDELQEYVYQAYQCGDYDSGFYSSSEDWKAGYKDPEEPLVKLQNNQKEIRELIKKGKRTK